jgi:alpha-tubulin suppressor-like RCC1 family protein
VICGAATPASAQFSAIAAGQGHSCAIIDSPSGNATCWGWNFYGQLGDGTYDRRNSSVAVSGELAFSSIATGYFHSCGIVVSPPGAAYCWGSNDFGQLGDGTRINRTFPVRVAVSGGLAFSSISAGFQHSCGIAVSPPPGGAYCWGSNSAGQLGDISIPIINRLSPVAIRGSSGTLAFSSVSPGFLHSCGIVVSPPGAAYCWGSNNAGQLGIGSTANALSPPGPRAVLGGLAFSSINVGNKYTCGIVVSPPGAVYCWGIVSGSTYRTTPVAISGGRTFSSISAGDSGACGIVESPPGDAYCFGTGSSGPPVAVTGGLKFASIVVGNQHRCGLVVSPPGVAYCWGSNGDGQLGDGTTSNRASPVVVTVLSSQTPLSASSTRSSTASSTSTATSTATSS